MNYTLQFDLSANDILECFPTYVRYNFSINFPITLEDSKYNGFTISTPSPYTLNSSGTELTFINFYLSTERGFSFTEFSDPRTYSGQVPVNGVPIKASKFTDLDRIKIQRKQPDPESSGPGFLLRNFGTVSPDDFGISYCHTRTYSLSTALS